MKLPVQLTLLLTTIFLVSACGAPATEAASAPASATATDLPDAAEPTGAAVASSEPSAAGQQVTVTLRDNTLTASVTTLQAGVPYHFVIINEGDHAHDFNINTPVSIAGSIAAAQTGALLTVPRSQLSEGATAIVDFTFPASAVGTQLEFSCLIRRHYSDGMFQAITVTE